jgi:hypothetical protein
MPAGKRQRKKNPGKKQSGRGGSAAGANSKSDETATATVSDAPIEGGDDLVESDAESDEAEATDTDVEARAAFGAHLSEKSSSSSSNSASIRSAAAVLVAAAAAETHPESDEVRKLREEVEGLKAKLAAAEKAKGKTKAEAAHLWMEDKGSTSTVTQRTKQSRCI